jgi:hypothetical protein
MLKTLAALVVAGTFVSVDAFTATPSLARVGITARTSALADHKHKLSLRRWLECFDGGEEKWREDFSPLFFVSIAFASHVHLLAEFRLAEYAAFGSAHSVWVLRFMLITDRP